jgi:hypothetical protein
MRWKLKTIKKRKKYKKKIFSCYAQDIMGNTKFKESSNQKTKNYSLKSQLENRKRCFQEKIYYKKIQWHYCISMSSI